MRAVFRHRPRKKDQRLLVRDVMPFWGQPLSEHMIIRLFVIEPTAGIRHSLTASPGGRMRKIKCVMFLVAHARKGLTLPTGRLSFLTDGFNPCKGKLPYALSH